MKLSLRSEYALLSLIHVARQSDKTATLAEIGVSLQIPSSTLSEVLGVLTSAKYLRMRSGFYRFAMPAEKISVAEIVRLFDGALAFLEPVSEMGYEPAPMEKEEKLAGLFLQLQEQIVNRLEATTVADLK
jgi:Rrf2 family protein